MIKGIASNLPALNAQRNLQSSRDAQGLALGQLSSGKRLTSAAVDAAASAIVERFAAQITGSNQAARNLSDGISLAQTAEGALTSVGDNSQRIRELAVQAGNGTLNAQDRAALQSEADALSQASADTLASASFNGQALFQGNTLRFQAGPNAGNEINLALGDLSSGVVASAAGRVDLSSPAKAQQALGQIDADIGTLSSQRATLGAVISRFGASIDALRNSSENLSAAKSRIGDTDYAKTSADLAAANIRAQAGIAMQAQANAQPRGVLSLLRS